MRRRRDYLGSFELMVLLAVMRLGDDAYGVPITRELEDHTGHEVAVASVYAALQRLEEKGLVSSSLGEPTPERGGKAKKYFRITGKGVREARNTQRALIRLWHKVPQLEGGKA
jgi:PadR family transcriptional regulator PadR